MKSVRKITCGCLSAALLVTAMAAGPAAVQGAAAPKLNQTSAALAVGKKLTLKVQNIKKGESVQWSSSKKSVAAVSSKGVVTAKAAGKTTIKAVVRKKTLKCTVQVTDVKGKDITKLLAGKSYEGTVAINIGGSDMNINVMNITFGSDGTVSGSKMNPETMILDDFSGTYKATLEGKNVTVSVQTKGETFTEKLTVKKSDYSLLSAKKKVGENVLTVSVKEIKE